MLLNVLSNTTPFVCDWGTCSDDDVGVRITLQCGLPSQHQPTHAPTHLAPTHLGAMFSHAARACVLLLLHSVAVVSGAGTSVGAAATSQGGRLRPPEQTREQAAEQAFKRRLLGRKQAVVAGVLGQLLEQADAALGLFSDDDCTEGGRPAKKRRAKAKAVARLDFDEKYMNMAPRRFWRRFRMTKRSFQKLSKHLRPHLETICAPNHGCTQVGGQVISVDCQLAMALRYFAGAQTVDIADIFGVDENTTVYDVVWKVWHTSTVLWDNCLQLPRAPPRAPLPATRRAPPPAPRAASTAALTVGRRRLWMGGWERSCVWLRVSDPPCVCPACLSHTRGCRAARSGCGRNQPLQRAADGLRPRGSGHGE